VNRWVERRVLGSAQDDKYERDGSRFRWRTTKQGQGRSRFLAMLGMEERRAERQKGGEAGGKKKGGGRKTGGEAEAGEGKEG